MNPNPSEDWADAMFTDADGPAPARPKKSDDAETATPLIATEPADRPPLPNDTTGSPSSPWCLFSCEQISAHGLDR